MNIKDIFLKAFALVSNPETFTTKVSARTKRGRPVNATDHVAVRFCSIGAIHHICNDDVKNKFPNIGKIVAALHEASPKKYRTIVDLNDKASHTTVVRTWKKAGRAKGWL